MSGHIFGRHNWDVVGIQWVEARNVAQHPTMHRTALTLKDGLVPNDRRAVVEKPQPTRSPSKEVSGIPQVSFLTPFVFIIAVKSSGMILLVCLLGLMAVP